MVLIHKLRQMEAVDIAQLRDGDAPDAAGGDAPDQPLGAAPASAKAPRRRPASPAHRPTTRSQTLGHPPPRKTRDDAEPAHAPARPKVIRQAPKRAIREVDSPAPAAPPSKRATPAPARAASEASTAASAAPTPAPTAYAFHNVSTRSELERGPRSRATLPVPVPNLTKKSRGRRVPTNAAVEKDAEQKAARVYMCQVENCGKCFHRGEHLKRHIRSIHTHEKPFKCSHPACDKYFNRHDNLLQHLKVHKDLPAVAHTEDSRQLSPEPQQRPQPPKPHIPVPIPYNSAPARVHYPSVYPIYPSYSLTSSHAPFSTNMAVSSLRTELPQSPPLRTPESFSRTRFRPVMFADDVQHAEPLRLRATGPYDWQP